MEKEQLIEIKKRIDKLGYKKKFVASKIGVDSVTFSYFLNGKRGMAEEKVIDLFRYLGL